MIAGCLVLAAVNLHAEPVTYEGCVIDADTLKPLEGALVVAIWKEWKGGGMVYRERFKLARECLTDKDGRWSLTGPAEARGADSDAAILTSFLTGYRTMGPRLFVYCKGYVGLGRTTFDFNGFIARPFQHEKTGIAGILFIKHGDTEEEKRIYRETYSGISTVPLVPLNNPHERLRQLDFDFLYPPNVRMIGNSFWSQESYVVHGLRKRTRSDQSSGGYPDLPQGAKAQVPNLYHLKNPPHRGRIILPHQVTPGKVVEVNRADHSGQVPDEKK